MRRAASRKTMPLSELPCESRPLNHLVTMWIAAERGYRVTAILLSGYQPSLARP